MQSKNAVGNLINRYRAVLKKCNLLNTFGSLAVAGALVLGSVGIAKAFEPTLNNQAAVGGLSIASSYSAEKVVAGKNYFSTFSTIENGESVTYGLSFNTSSTDVADPYTSIELVLSSDPHTFSIKTKDASGADLTQYYAVKDNNGSVITQTSSVVSDDDITQNFIGLSGALGPKNESQSIVGDFINNSVNTTDLAAAGGAIHGMAYTIVGDFINNSATSTNSRAYGGAIDRSDNVDGLDTIDSITGDFIFNSASGVAEARGGAISDESRIKNITGDFINNSVITSATTGFTLAYGGAISGPVTTLTGNFINNSVTSNNNDATTSSADGGAISGSVDRLNGSFINNSVTANAGFVGGGAINTLSNLTLVATGSNTNIFSGNYTSLAGNMDYNAINFTANNKTLTFEMQDEGKFIFNDNIRATNQDEDTLTYAVVIKGTDASKNILSLNNAWYNASSVSVEDATLNFGKGPYGVGSIGSATLNVKGISTLSSTTSSPLDFSGAVSIENNATLNLTASQLSLSGGITNNGIVNIATANATDTNPSTTFFENSYSGTGKLDIAEFNTLKMPIAAEVTLAEVNNVGYLQLEGSGTTTFTENVTGNGSILVMGDTIKFNGASALEIANTIGGGYVMEVAGAGATFFETVTVTDLKVDANTTFNTNVTGSALTVADGITVTFKGKRMTLASATFKAGGSSGIVVVSSENARLNISDASTYANFDITDKAATLILNGSGGTLNSVTNAGTLNINGNTSLSKSVTGTGTIEVASGKSMTVSEDLITIENSVSAADATFVVNSGKQATFTGAETKLGTITNSGTINTQSTTTTLEQGYTGETNTTFTVGGGSTAATTTLAENKNFTINDNASLSVASKGTLDLSKGTLTVQANATTFEVLSGGKLIAKAEDFGTFKQDGSFTKDGTVDKVLTNYGNLILTGFTFEIAKADIGIYENLLANVLTLAGSTGTVTFEGLDMSNTYSLTTVPVGFNQGSVTAGMLGGLKNVTVDVVKNNAVTESTVQSGSTLNIIGENKVLIAGSMSNNGTISLGTGAVQGAYLANTGSTNTVTGDAVFNKAVSGDGAFSVNSGSATFTGGATSLNATLSGGDVVLESSGSLSAVSITHADSSLTIKSGTWTTSSDISIINGSIIISGGTLSTGKSLNTQAGSLSVTASGTLDISADTLSANFADFGTVDLNTGNFTKESSMSGTLVGDAGTVLNLNSSVTGLLFEDEYNAMINQLKGFFNGSFAGTINVTGIDKYSFLDDLDDTTDGVDKLVGAGRYDFAGNSTIAGLTYADRAQTNADSTISGGGELYLTGNTGQERVLSVGNITLTNGYLSLGYDDINGTATDGGTVQGDLIVDEASTKTASANIYGTTVTVDGAVKALSGGVIYVNDDSTFTAASLEVNGAGSTFYTHENVSIIGSLTVANGGDLSIVSGRAVNVGGVTSIGGSHDFAAGTVNAKGGLTVSSELILTNANLTSEANLTGAKINLGNKSTLKLAGTKGGSIAQEVVATTGGIDVAGGTWTAKGNISVTGAGSLKVTGGILDVSGADLTLSASATAFSTASGATLKAKGDDFLTVDASTGTISKATTLGTALKNDGTLALTGLDILFGADASRAEKVQMESQLQTAGILAAGSVGTVDYIGVDFDGLYSLSFVDEGDTAFQNGSQNIMAGTLSGNGRTVNAAGIVVNDTTTPNLTNSSINANNTLNLSGNNANNVLLDQGSLTNNGTLNLGMATAEYTASINGTLTNTATTNVLSNVTFNKSVNLTGGTFDIQGGMVDASTITFTTASGSILKSSAGSTLNVSHTSIGIQADGLTNTTASVHDNTDVSALFGEVIISGFTATLDYNTTYATVRTAAQEAFGSAKISFEGITLDLSSTTLDNVIANNDNTLGGYTIKMGSLTAVPNGTNIVVGAISDGEGKTLTIADGGELSITGNTASENGGKLYDGHLEIATNGKLITGNGSIENLVNVGGTVEIQGETKVTDFVQTNGTTNITAGKLIVENFTLGNGGMNVGNGTSKGELIAQNVEGKGNIIFHDPAWVNGVGIDGASTGVYKNFASGNVDAKLIAGQNSYVVLGDVDTAWAQTSFKNSGLEWSSSKITAALFINEAQTLDATMGAVVVDGSKTASFTPTSNTATFADKSLLVVNASNLGTSAALTAVNSGFHPPELSVADSSTLVISGGQAGQSVIVVDGFGIAGTSANVLGWGVGETYDAENAKYDTLMTDSRAVGIDENTTTFFDDSEGRFVVGLKALQVELPKVNDSVNDFLTEAGNTTLDAERQLFVDYVNNTGTDANQAGATIQGTVQAVQTAGVAATGADVSNAVAQTLASRTNMSALGIEAEEGAALVLNDGELGMNAGDTLNKMTDGLAVWLMPIYEHSSVSGMKSDGFTSGYSTDLGGMALGADYTFDKYRLGLAINAGGGSTTSSGDFNESKNNFDFFGVSLYGGLRHNNFALNADLGYSRINNDISQDMPTASGLGSHSADVNTDVWTMGVNAEYLISTQYVDIIPHAGIRYMNIRTGSHSIENGGSTLFDVNANSQDVWTFPLGVAFEKEYNLASGWELTPKADVGVVFAAGDLTSRTRASMPGVQSALEMEMQNIDSVAFNGGIGIDVASPSKNTTFSLNYNLQASEHETSHGLQATFRYEF